MDIVGYVEMHTSSADVWCNSVPTAINVCLAFVAPIEHQQIVFQSRPQPTILVVRKTANAARYRPPAKIIKPV